MAGWKEWRLPQSAAATVEVLVVQVLQFVAAVRTSGRIPATFSRIR